MSAEFNGELLRLARQFRRLSQRDLAARMGDDASKVSRAENGVTAPSDQFVGRAAAVLNFPREFFTLPDRDCGLPISVHPMWRKRETVSQADIERVLAEINIRLMHLRRLIRSLDYEPLYPVPQLDIDAYDGDVEGIAQAVRRAWTLPAGPLLGLTAAAERAGCFVVHTDFGDALVDGVTLRAPDAPPCIFLNRTQPGDRLRFTLAHELGHIVMHRVPTPSMEDEANAFARALLMPANDIRPQLSARRIDLRTLAVLKPEWQVSMQAILYRARDIGLIETPNKWRYLWQQFNAQQIRRREPPELDFPPEQPEIMPKVLALHVGTPGYGYSLEEMERVLAMHAEELVEFHGLGPLLPGSPSPGRPPLRLVS